jgi:hypothetical protein
MGARWKQAAQVARVWTVLAVAAGLAMAAPGGRAADDGARVAAVEALGRLPLLFVPEEVGPDGAAAYAVRGQDASLWLTGRGLTYRLHPAGESAEEAPGSWVVALDLVDAAPRAPVGGEPLATRVSYFKGPKASWRTGLPSYSSVVYREPWPGVDLVVSGTAGELESTFVVRPGADPGAIRLAYRGASGVSLKGDGGLTVETPLGPIDELAPVAWQEVDGRRVPVAAAFELEEGCEPGVQAYRFRLGEYDPTRELVVDPVTLVYCGYIGGSDLEVVADAAVDASGSLYVVGITFSDEATFPVKVGPDLSFNGIEDAFVAKVLPDGSGLEYLGYIGGSGNDEGIGVAVDDSGNVYVAGGTYSSEASFPVTVGPDLTYNGDRDAFVAKVNAAGTALEYCGYIGGSGEESGVVAIDAAGRAYVVGPTTSTEASFPVAVGPDLSYNGGTYDVFVARVNAAGTALDYCGYVGGSGEEISYPPEVDGAGRLYVAGSTTSTEASFPVAVGPDLSHNGLNDAFVTRVNADGTALDYCGYIGGSGQDSGAAVAVDVVGHAYVVGYTVSTQATFPVAVGPDLTHNGSYDTFVAKVDPLGTTLLYCGYVGGSGMDQGNDIALDAAGNAYVVGATSSSEATFPVLGGPDLTYNGGTRDAFVARVNAGGTALDYCGYIGGSGNEDPVTPETINVALDALGNVYVTGGTTSSEASFPVLVGPDLSFNGGTWDNFVAKVTAFDLIFGDNFVTGDTTAWSYTQP